MKSAEPKTAVLGFVGTGIMGVPMAKNLMAAGYEVIVWNRSADKCAPLLEAGARSGATPASVAAEADFTFAMLADDAAAQAVLEGPEGICAGIKGRGYVDMSTLSTEVAIENAARVVAAGGAYVEAPVSGSKAPAEQGQLIFLAAGDKELYTAVAGPLDVMGKAKFYLGAPGAGTRMKLVANMMMGTIMASLAEGIHLAEKSDLSAEVLLEVLALGAMANPMFKLKGPAMVEGQNATAFPFKHQSKDMAYALDLADSLGVNPRAAAAAHEYYTLPPGDASGLGDEDFSSVIKVVRAEGVSP